MSTTEDLVAPKPRAIVLDDSRTALKMTARQLRARGFEVVECGTVSEFDRAWRPGTVDVVIADWELSMADRGDRVLRAIRRKDWEVPFILVSGKLQDDGKRASVLRVLVKSGAARFVVRGHGGIAKACDEAETMLNRRDPALQKVILAFRRGALAGREIQTSSGRMRMDEMLADIVASPEASREAEAPLVEMWSKRRARRRPNG